MSQLSSDKELISSISRGDKDAFNVLYRRHWADLYKFAFFILRDKDACKDIIQDVFIWVWEHRERLEMQSPKSYLKSAVKYKIANYIRTGNIRSSFFEETAQVAVAESIPEAVEITELKELTHIIQLSVSNLPVKCQRIFRLSREENLSNREIARQLGISVKTVENQITIAIHRLRTIVE